MISKKFKAPYIGCESPLTSTTRLLFTVNPKESLGLMKGWVDHWTTKF